MSAVSPKESPPLGLVAPFFVTAPLGLVGAGILLLLAGNDAFLAVNAPRLVAATHAAVLGWLTLSIMGAIYQLGPAVLGGRLISQRWVRIQFGIHVVSVVGFVIALEAWDVRVMAAAGAGAAVSLIIFLVIAFPAVRGPGRDSIVRTYVSVALVFLAAAATAGVTYLGTLEHLWFPVTQGRLSGHAHLGLLGWLGLMIMGVSYQLIPMFQVVRRGVPRFARPVLLVTAVSAGAGGLILMTDPSMPVRAVVAVAMAAGPILWIFDVWSMLKARSRRIVDVHTRATVVSLGFLAAAAVLGVLAAVGEPVAPGGEPARMQLAYGICAIGGWAGTTLIGNSFKIVPFLVWNARYRERAGFERVPLVADLVNESWTNATLAVHAVAVATLGVGALAGQIAILHAGGLLLAIGGAGNLGVLLSVLIHRPARHAAGTPAGQVTP